MEYVIAGACQAVSTKSFHKIIPVDGACNHTFTEAAPLAFECGSVVARTQRHTYRQRLTLPKCRLSREVDYESMASLSNMSVVQVFLGRPRDLLSSFFPSMCCRCDKLCLIRCPRYCNFLVLNCRSTSLPVPSLLNTASSLVILSVHDIFNTLRYTHISNASSLDNID